MEKFYITTAIAYTSRKPHIGNTYEIVLTDAIARYKRLQGYDVFFCTGTDEHGQKIEEIAKKEGISPKAYVDKVAGEIKDIWNLMNTSYTKFIRTTDDYHEKTVQKIFKKLYDQGDIYKSEYEGWYCVPCESFFTETQLEGGKCPDCGRDVKKTKEEAYFFKMSKYQDKLMKYIEQNPDFIQPESRKKEMVNNFLKPGLQDLCVSRTSFKWGIPVTFDEKHVIYVWIDALTNYITALGYDCGKNSDNYNKYWPCDVHIIGKDILRFHTIYWPIMLMALGEPLPKKVFGHPWLLSGNDKMSKSKGNVMYADDLVRHFGVDAIRYYLLHEMPFAQDGTISYETIIARYNADLANTLGNLLNRTVAMVNKYFGGEVKKTGYSDEFSQDLIKCAGETVQKVNDCMNNLRVCDALDAVFEFAKRSNKYIDETAPWVLAKNEDNKDKLSAVLFNLIESLRYIGVLLKAFMPDTATEILRQTGSLEADTLESLAAFGGAFSTACVSQAKPIFARIDEKVKLEEIESEIEESSEEKTPELPEIEMADFEKLDLRCGKVLSCEKVEKTDKLLKFEIECAQGSRTIVSGIASYYKPQDLVGKTVVYIANLKPVKIRGILSRGMILSAEDSNGLSVLTTQREVESGSKVV